MQQGLRPHTFFSMHPTFTYNQVNHKHFLSSLPERHELLSLNMTTTLSNPRADGPSFQSFQDVYFIEEYCDACHSLGIIFQGQKPHRETCITGSVIGILATAQSWIQNTKIHHFINNLLAIDTKKIRVAPCPEMLQCGRCERFYSRITAAHHILCCGSTIRQEDKPQAYFTDLQAERNTFLTSHTNRHAFLNYLAVGVTFVFTDSFHLLIHFC